MNQISPILHDATTVIDQVTCAPLREFLDDHDKFADLQEVNVNKSGQLILQDRRGNKQFINDARIDVQWADDLCQQLARLHGLPYEEGHRTVSTRLTGGHRFTAAVGKESIGSGVAISIRVKRHFKASPEDFGLTAHQSTLLRTAIKEGWNIAISGATGTGKTTFMDMLLDWVPLDVRLGLVQDAGELNPPHEDKVEYFVPRHEHAKGNRMGATEIMDILIRQNPGRVVNGELSISNTPYTLFLMNEGHEGTILTMHANDPLECLEGFKTRMTLGGFGSEGVISQLVRNLGLIVHISNDKGRRYVSHMVAPSDLPWQTLEGDAANMPALGTGFILPKGSPGTPSANMFHFRNYLRQQKSRARVDQADIMSMVGELDEMERAEYFGNYAPRAQ